MPEYSLQRLLIILLAIPLNVFAAYSTTGAANVWKRDPHSFPVITPENADQVKQIALLARSVPVNIALSPDGKTLAASTYAGIWFYDANDLAAKPRLFIENFHADKGLAFSPDGKTLAATTLGSGGCTDTIQFFDVITATIKQDFYAACAGHFAFSLDGTIFAYGTTDGAIALKDLRTGFYKYFHGHKSNVVALAFRPDGKQLASGSFDQLPTDNPLQLSSPIRLWNVQTGELENILLGHGNIVTDVAYSPDGKLLASASNDNTARLWNITEHNQVAVFRYDTKTGYIINECQSISRWKRI